MTYNDVIYSSVNVDEFEIDEREFRARIGANITLVSLKDKLNLYNSVVQYKYAYIRIPVKVKDNICVFDFDEVKSTSLSKTLKNTDEVYILAVSAGIEVDRLISKAYINNQVDGFIFDAIASAGIESFADYITKQINEIAITTNRFSPGYADLPLAFQKPLLNRLNATQTVGISLNDKLLMIPQKSITAIMGVKN